MTPIIFNGTNIPTTGNIVYNGTNLTKVIFNGVTVWEKESAFGGLCFTAEQANSSVTLGKIGSPAWSGYYSTDGTTWTSYVPGTTGAITLTNIGDKVYFKGLHSANQDVYNYLQFSMSGQIAASGNIMSLCNGDSYASHNEIFWDYQFYRLFVSCTALTSAPLLPATTLTENCYNDLFHGCTSLVTAPALPATTLKNACYRFMFRGCTSLVNAPTLSATTLTDKCYQAMFEGCTSLVNAPALPAETLADYCYHSMFRECTSIVSAPALPATTLKESCYRYMFKGCTSLVNAPALPATTLQAHCYNYMFYVCTSLQVNDTPTGDASYSWTIPTTGVFTNTTTYKQDSLFTNCPGTRLYNYITGAQGESHTYYTQNPPIS